MAENPVSYVEQVNVRPNLLQKLDQIDTAGQELTTELVKKRGISPQDNSKLSELSRQVANTIEPADVRELYELARRRVEVAKAQGEWTPGNPLRGQGGAQFVFATEVLKNVPVLGAESWMQWTGDINTRVRNEAEQIMSDIVERYKKEGRLYTADTLNQQYAKEITDWYQTYTDQYTQQAQAVPHQE